MSFAVLAGEVDVGMDDAHVAGQSIASAERLLLRAEVAADLLLLPVVDGVFVAREVVRPGEDGVAGLAGARVDSVAPVRTGLRVSLHQSC